MADNIDDQQRIDNRLRKRHCTDADCRAMKNKLIICKGCGRNV